MATLQLIQALMPKIFRLSALICLVGEVPGESFLPVLWQNGSEVYSEDENTLFPDQEIAIEVLQKTADTYVQHKVAASPEFFGQVGMSSIQLMENDRLAMFLSGNWRSRGVIQHEHRLWRSSGTHYGARLRGLGAFRSHCCQ